MSKTQPIAFFDSGVGLYSVLKETKKRLPMEDYVIFADQNNNPFGEKSQSEIMEFTANAAGFLINKHDIKMMVLACNTATVLALNSLRKTFKIPIVGVVPAIKPAASRTKKARIAVMSTPATAKSAYLSNLVSKFSPHARVLKLGCPGLEEAIEILDEQKILKLVKKYTQIVKSFGADTLVLGCTHYPLVKNLVKKNLGRDIAVIDSSKAVAKRVDSLLELSGKKSTRRNGDIYYTTKDPGQFSLVSSRILKARVEASLAQL
jgi:glutamate racemase